MRPSSFSGKVPSAGWPPLQSDRGSVEDHECSGVCKDGMQCCGWLRSGRCTRAI